jgi:hypothetical protein
MASVGLLPGCNVRYFFSRVHSSCLASGMTPQWREMSFACVSMTTTHRDKPRSRWMTRSVGPEKCKEFCQRFYRLYSNAEADRGMAGLHYLREPVARHQETQGMSFWHIEIFSILQLFLWHHFGITMVPLWWFFEISFWCHFKLVLFWCHYCN